MARGGKQFKLYHHNVKSQTPTPRASRQKKVEHNCYASSKDGSASVSTTFVTMAEPPANKAPFQTGAHPTVDAEPTIVYDPAYLEHLVEVDEDTPRRKRTASDDPMKMWLPYRDQYLQEFINMDGCGDRPTESHVAQLLRSRLFPATVINPKTAATFRLLKTFELLSYESKVSAFQFSNTLSRLTDNTGLFTPKDRYLALLLMIRQWRHIKMLKRAARGHEKNGIATTKAGQCAVECPACPHPKKNMPANWRDVPINQKFKHALHIGIDANFQMKRKDVSSEALDPGLGDGFAYFVETAPYKEHLANHKTEVEPKSNCSRHDAMNLANSKSCHGLAATGIGTIECSRHDMKRPCSVGDLQVGERNMDYLFYHSVIYSDLECYVVSYDIACQWSVNLCECMFNLDHEFFMLNDSIQVRFFVPKFHLPAHILACRTTFSFNYGLGVGRTDGEAPERGWAEINPLASSTKEMGPGSRRDALDSHFGDYNWRKVTNMGRTFLCKFKAASTDTIDHVTAHHQLNTSLPTDLFIKWTAEVEAWERDPSQPNPLVSIVQTPTQAAVRRKLAESEALNAGTAAETSLDERVSPSVLIACGLEIEVDQRALQVEACKIWVHSQDRQWTKLQLRANVLQRKITTWFGLQQVYIPGVLNLQRAKEHAAAAQRTTLLSYTRSLWLPSQIGSKLPFGLDLADIEWQLRVAQAYEALDSLWRLLQIQAHLWAFKDRFI
ncbi:hypothetical protein C0991_000506 [Blastosporella zonata]|nr:hypothetical protein C0991_000506 [Blastosporella zonata]